MPGLGRVAQALTVAALLGLGSPTLATANELRTQLDIRPNNRTEGQPRDVADQLLRLGGSQEAAGEYRQAINSWRQALAIYQEIGDMAASGIAYDYIGLTYGSLGRYVEAEEALRRRLAVARDNADFQGQIFGWNNLGSIFIQRGDVGLAQTAFNEALTIARSLNSYQGIGLSLSNLALVATARRNRQEAVKLYEAAANYRFQAGDRMGEANTLNGLGDAYRSFFQISDAIGAYRLALRSGRELDDVAIQLRAIDGLLAIYLDRGDLQDARALLDQRVTLTARQADQWQQLNTLRLLGEYYEQLGEWGLAKNFYEQALAIAQRLEDSQAVVSLNNRLIDLSNVSPDS